MIPSEWLDRPLGHFCVMKLKKAGAYEPVMLDLRQAPDHGVSVKVN